MKRRISPGNGDSAGSEVVPAREEKRDQISPASSQQAEEGRSSKDDGHRDASEHGRDWQDLVPPGPTPHTLRDLLSPRSAHILPS